MSLVAELVRHIAGPLERIAAALEARADEGGHDHSLEEAARILRCKPRWLQDNYRRFVRQEYGREAALTDEEIDLIREACRIDPTSGVSDAADAEVPALAQIRPSTRSRRRVG
jgi:hypothetical protein